MPGHPLSWENIACIVVFLLGTFLAAYVADNAFHRQDLTCQEHMETCL